MSQLGKNALRKVLEIFEQEVSTLEQNIASKTNSNHTHTEYASSNHGHSEYASSSHNHTEYAISNHTHTAAHVGAAAINHTHTAASIGAAASNHTHSGYAATSHTHTGYATSNHQHPSSSVNSIALGNYASASSNSISIGVNAKTIYGGSVVIGSPSVGASAYCVSIGHNSNANYGSVAIGYNTLASNHYSVAIGSNAIAGNCGISIGNGANISGTYGFKSIAVGENSRVVNVTSSIAIGLSSSVTANRSMAIGTNAATANANSIQLGNAAQLSSITAKVGITVTSDERDKTDIVDLDNATEFIRRIRLIRYVFNNRDMYIDRDNLSETDQDNINKYGICEYDREAHAAGTKKGNRIRVGVSAQQVVSVMNELFGSTDYANIVNDNLYDFDPTEIPEGVESKLGVNYEAFIPFLLKGFQELDNRLTIIESRGES